MWDVVVRAVAAGLMMGLAVALFFLLRFKVQATWRLMGIGAATFVASQVVHIPLNMFILLPLFKALGLSLESTGSSLWVFAIFMALSAGVCEEVARYLVYLCWLPRGDRRYKAAVSLGGGHGGCEAIILGLFSLFVLIELSYLRNKDLDKLFPHEQAAQVRELLQTYWSLQWYNVLMGPVERITAMVYHMSAAVLVLQVFRTHNFVWLGAAIGFHTFIDTLAVVAVAEKWNPIAAEVILAVFTIPLAVWILLAFADEPEEMEQDESALLLADDVEQVEHANVQEEQTPTDEPAESGAATGNDGAETHQMV